MDRHTNTHAETKSKYFNVCVLFWLRRMAVSVEIFRFCFRVCVRTCLSTVNSSIFGKSSHFSFPYFVLFVLWYFPLPVVYWNDNLLIIIVYSIPTFVILLCTTDCSWTLRFEKVGGFWQHCNSINSKNVVNYWNNNNLHAKDFC